MVNNSLCPVVIEPQDTIKEYKVIYTNGMRKEIKAHNMDEAWNIAYSEPYEVLDVVKRR